MEALAAEDELKIFDDHMHVFYGFSLRLSFRDLAHWLILRATQVGPATALEDLKRYLREEKVPYVKIAAVAGIELEQETEFSDGIRLVHFGNVPDSFQKRIVGPRPMDHFPQRLIPTCALVCSVAVEKQYSAAAQTEFTLTVQGDRNLHDPSLIISTVALWPTAILASWGSPEPWVPCGHLAKGWSASLAIDFGRIHTKRLSRDEIAAAAELYRKYTQLDELRKARVRLPLSRLNQAMRRVSLIDAAIDVCIALETLFLNEEDPGPTERGLSLRLRAARSLGASLEERGDIYSVIRGAYRIRSAGVHSGKIPDKVEGRPVDEVLNRAFQVAARAITRSIEEGLPDDWTRLLLS